MGDFDDIFPDCSDCGGVDWVDGVCPECGQKLADLIDNYDGAPWHAYDYERDTPSLKVKHTMKQEF